MQNNVNCGQAADFWNRYEEDIDRAVGLNSTCFRLSVEWGRLEPVQGQIDQHGLQRYHEIFDCLARCGLHCSSRSLQNWLQGIVSPTPTAQIS